MATEQEPNLVQLATRVPRDLQRKMKLFCVKEGVSVMQFVTQAITKALNKASK